MKNVFKKAIAAASAAVLCAVPMTSSFASAAKVQRFETYRTYFNIRTWSGITDATFKISTISAINFYGAKLGNLGGYFENFGSGTTNNRISVFAFHNNNTPIYSAGTLVNATTGTADSTLDICDVEIPFNDVIKTANKDIDNIYNYVYARTVLVGDANSDGYVNSADETRIKSMFTRANGDRVVVNDDVDLYAADINNDGHVNVNDYNLLVQYNKDQTSKLFTQFAK